MSGIESNQAGFPHSCKMNLSTLVHVGFKHDDTSSSHDGFDGMRVRYKMLYSLWLESRAPTLNYVLIRD